MGKGESLSALRRNSGIITTVIAAVGFYVLNVLTPEYHDDYVYKFMMVDGAADFTRPIGSVADILLSQAHHYMAVNGRSVTHCLVQLFTGLLGKPVFNVLNTLVFAAFIYLLQRNVGGKVHHNRLLPVAATLALVLLLPRFKDTFLWMTGSVNYLWSATGAVAFIGIYERQRDDRVDKRLWWILPLALLLGWTHEGITVPLGAALVVTQIMRRRSRHSQGWWLAGAFMAGACLAALAPGTIARSAAQGGFGASALGLKVVNLFTILSQLKLIYIALIAGVCLWAVNRPQAKRVLADNAFLLVAIVIAGAIALVAGIASTRTAFGMELFSLILALRLIAELLPWSRKRLMRWCGLLVVGALIVFYGMLLYHTTLSWTEAQRLTYQIENTHDGIIGTHEHDCGPVTDYVCTMISRDATAGAVNYDAHGWPASMAATYHRDSLVFLPQAFLDDLKRHPERYETLDRQTPFEFYVQRLGAQQSVQEVRFTLGPADYSALPFYFRPVARCMNRYTDSEVTSDKWAIVTLYGKRYLLIKKIHEHGLDGRVTDIKIISR